MTVDDGGMVVALGLDDVIKIFNEKKSHFIQKNWQVFKYLDLSKITLLRLKLI